MVTQSLFIFFLFFLPSLYYVSHAHYTPRSEILHESPLDYLNAIKGSHKGQIAKGLNKLKKYFTNIGYIQINNTTDQIDSSNDHFDDTLESAIKKYQEFYGLNITGILDQETLDLLSLPRCGMPDFSPNGSLYTFLPIPKWPPGKRNITFSYPKNFRNDARIPMAKAFARWMQVSPFRFTYIDDFEKADVKISFERRDHGDSKPFDGPNGILAHTIWPPKRKIHFDADEKWIIDNGKGDVYLQSVAMHELGHVLGLGHSKEHKAIMYALIPGTRKDLNDDDIQGIRALYPN